MYPCHIRSTRFSSPRGHVCPTIFSHQKLQWPTPRIAPRDALTLPLSTAASDNHIAVRELERVVNFLFTQDRERHLPRSTAWNRGHCGPTDLENVAQADGRDEAIDYGRHCRHQAWQSTGGHDRGFQRSRACLLREHDDGADEELDGNSQRLHLGQVSRSKLGLDLRYRPAAR